MVLRVGNPLPNPGAATLGDPLNLGFALASATVSPRQDFALALRADDSSLVLVRAGRFAAIPKTRPAPALMVFSPAGTAARTRLALRNVVANRTRIGLFFFMAKGVVCSGLSSGFDWQLKRLPRFARVPLI